MKRSIYIKTIFLCFTLLLTCSPAAGNTLPLDVKKLSDRIMVVSTMTGNSRTAVIHSGSGLVMINAPISPDFTRRIKAMAEKTFGSTSWRYMIQTTPGDLNIGGSEALSGAVIISHIETRQAIKKQEKSLRKWLTWRASEFEERVTRSTAMLKKMDPQSDRARGMKQWIELCRYIAGEFKKDFAIPAARMTFTDQVQMDLGDMTMNLVFFGSSSSTGQVFLWIPEEKFAWLSDAFHAWHILPHQAYLGKSADVKRWLRVLDTVLSPANNIRHIFRCNGGAWTIEQLRQRRNLIEDIYQKTLRADKEGLDLDTILAKMKNWESEFPYLKNHLNYRKGLESLVTSDILTTVKGIWKVTHKSAAEMIEEELEKKGLTAAAHLFETLKKQNSRDVYFSEAEFNQLGYKYLGEEKTAEATEIFRINTVLYPWSANAYDSLGEACMKSGNRKLAIRNYKKSLELNPENNNARKMLEQLKGK